MGLLGAVLVIALGMGCRWKDEPTGGSVDGAGSAPRSFAPLVKRVLPAVVGVYTTTSTHDPRITKGLAADSSANFPTS